MARKRHRSEPTVSRTRTTGHGSFKHVAKPATLKAMLRTYGLKMSDYVRVKNLVSTL